MKLAIALQCYEGDVWKAKKLTQLICDIEPTKRTDIEFILSARRGTNPNAVRDIVEIARTKFESVMLIKGKRFGTGHPNGCNDLWSETMSRIENASKDGRIKSTGVLTFEPDCVPLRSDWLDALWTEWQIASAMGKLCLGHAHGAPTHINGNAIFDTEIIRKAHAHGVDLNGSSSTGGWDVVHGQYLLKVGADTNLIYQLYRIPSLTIEQLALIRKNGEIPALFHGCKSDDIFDEARRLLLTDVCMGLPNPTWITPSDLPKFSISILAMNGREVTQRCIESVLKFSSQSFELLLWDNGSTDGTDEYFDAIAAQHENIFVTHTDENKGFIEPNNKHLLQARGKYFVCLNNDTEVDQFWLEHLELPFNTHKTAALTGPGGGCNELNPNFHGFPGKTTEYIEGSCLCGPTALLREKGLFAPYIDFAYGEDVDLSLRMRRDGHTIHQVPFRLKHQRGMTSQHIPGIREIQQHNHHVLNKVWGEYMKTRKFPNE